MPPRPRQTAATRARVWLTEGREIVRVNFGLTPREREGVVLVCALFVFGLAVQWLRWLLGK